MNESELYKTIYTCLETEDAEFAKLTYKGIFYAPELYIAITIGKAIKENEQAIFDTEAKWIRETDFGNGGPTDFAFKLGDTIVVFELKLRQTVHSYKSDIKKLKLLQDTVDISYQKYFIALVDSWKKDEGNDGRITELEDKYPDLYRIADFDKFETKQDRYVGDIVCNVACWGLGGNTNEQRVEVLEG